MGDFDEQVSVKAKGKKSPWSGAEERPRQERSEDADQVGCRRWEARSGGSHPASLLPGPSLRPRTIAGAEARQGGAP